MTDDDHDKLLPIANVGRIMKQILPPNAKVSREAKETMQECASEFISFVTAEASSLCRKDNRKTVNGDDLCLALTSLGFDYYSEAMSRYLQKLRDFQMRKAAAAAAAQGGNCNNNANNEPSSSEQMEAGASTYSDKWIDFGILNKRGNNSLAKG